jgi:cytochrome c oxidase subunit 3
MGTKQQLENRMATTIPEPPKLSPAENDIECPSHGDGGFRNLGPAPTDVRRVKDPSSPPPASTGIWVGLAGITMTFAAFTSALIVRQGGSTDWQHFTLPRILFLNSLTIIASSFTLERARTQIAAYMGAAKKPVKPPASALYATLGLGLLFVAGQTYAWLQLKSQGFGLATNVSYSFFYVLTVAHALHLLGGLGGLVRVMSKLNHSALKRSTLNATSIYWHFMGALWLYLLLLLWIKL